MKNDPLLALRTLRTPEAIQDFIDTLPYNYEKQGETCSGPSQTLRRGNAHCLEAALVACAALAQLGYRPLLMNLQTGPGDQDHAVALFKRDGLWGAISKTNHAVLQYRDPVYRTTRELALSYFHEYFLSSNGRKTLRAYSNVFGLSRFKGWVTAEEDVWHIAYALKDALHRPIAPAAVLKKMRRATAFVRTATNATEWKKSDPRT